jgi:hypothetical protein
MVTSKQRKALRMNQEAMMALVMSFINDQCMLVYFSTKSADWPNSVAWKIMKAIHDEYQSCNHISLVEYCRRLSEVKLKESEEPKVLFEQLASIRNMFSKAAFKINEEDLIAVVMEKAPHKYATVMTVVQATKGDALSLQDLNKVMGNLYRMDMSNLKLDTDKDSEKSEIALGAVDKSVKCYTCGKPGHKSYQCKSKDGKKEEVNSKKGKFKGTCNQCGKQGHKKKDCWDLPENEDKHAKNYKPKAGTGSGSGGENRAVGIEALLCCVDGPDKNGVEYVTDGYDGSGCPVGEVGGVSFGGNT